MAIKNDSIWSFPWKGWELADRTVSDSEHWNVCFATCICHSGGIHMAAGREGLHFIFYSEEVSGISLFFSLSDKKFSPSFPA